MSATLDHLLWGCRDLDAAVADLYERSGVRAAFGGVHPELGTQNALARLDDGVFLGNQTVGLFLTATGQAGIGSPSSAVLTIVDDEPAPPNVFQFSDPRLRRRQV